MAEAETRVVAPSAVSSNKTDSFAERRELFKNIWDEALLLDDEEPNITKKKVIKTMRLDQNHSLNIGPNKKERIKNLRTVCTRLLKYCDHQEANDAIAAAYQDSNDTSADFSTKKKRRFRKKKKVQQSGSDVVLTSTTDSTKPKPSFEVNEDGPKTHRGTKITRDSSSSKIRKSTLIEQFLSERNNLQGQDSNVSDQKGVPRKVIKKKHRKRKRLSGLP